MTRPPRASAKAVIADEDRMLVIHLRHEQSGDHYQLPGGGVERGEGLAEAVRRETREETGYTVAVHELLWVRDYVAANHDYAFLDPPGFHAVELMYRCTLAHPAAVEPHEADELQIGVEWVTGGRLSDIEFHPRALVGRLQAYLADRTVVRPVYLGETA
jgi:ADP-ribose pyrophosphatase YjhB (NUDIX family)